MITGAYGEVGHRRSGTTPRRYRRRGDHPRTIGLHRHYPGASRGVHPQRPWTRDAEPSAASWPATPPRSAETMRSAPSTGVNFYRSVRTEGRLAIDPSANLPPFGAHWGASDRPQRPSCAARWSSPAAGTAGLLLAANGGLGCCEIAAAHPGDLDLAGVLSLTGNGGKIRIAPACTRRSSTPSTP